MSGIPTLYSTTIELTNGIEVREDLRDKRIDADVKEYLRYALPLRTLEKTRELLAKLQLPPEVGNLLVSLPRISETTEIALISNSLNHKLSVKDAQRILDLLKSS